jgi:hypothetical protein
LLGECLFHGLPFFKGQLAVDGDFECHTALLDDEADLLSHGQVVGIVADASERHDRGPQDLLASLERIKALPQQRDAFRALLGSASRISGARFLGSSHVLTGADQDTYGDRYLGWS